MDWTIQDLGSLGELVGAVVVVASLIYIGLQVKQNTMATRSATMQAIFQNTSETWRATTLDLDRTTQFYKISKSDNPTGPERIFASAYVLQTLRAHENIFYQLKYGMLDERYVHLEQRTSNYFSSRLYRKQWDDRLIQGWLSEEYVSFVDGVLAA